MYNVIVEAFLCVVGKFLDSFGIFVALAPNLGIFAILRVSVDSEIVSGNGFYAKEEDPS